MRSDGVGGPITVVTAADAAYALPLAVTLRSLVDRAAAGRELALHVIDDGLGGDLRRRVEASVAEVRIWWLDPPDAPADGLPLWGRMPATTYHKLALPDVLPEAGRALWLDADLVLTDDVGALWDTPLEGRAAGAVPDPFVTEVSDRLGVAGWRELGLPADGPYFNAGVMLLDLDRWRRDDVAARAREYLRRFRDQVFFHDQEALNAVLAGEWLRLPERWNRSVVAAGLGRTEGAPSILHYSGTLKPWVHRGGGRLHRLYYEHLDRTEWRGWRPPRSLRTALIDLYQRSGLRRLLHPLERRWFRRWVERTRWATG